MVMLTRLPPTTSASSSMRKPNGPHNRNRLSTQIVPLSFLRVPSHNAASLIQLWASSKLRYRDVFRFDASELREFGVRRQQYLRSLPPGRNREAVGPGESPVSEFPERASPGGVLIGGNNLQGRPPDLSVLDFCDVDAFFLRCLVVELSEVDL